MTFYFSVVKIIIFLIDMTLIKKLLYLAFLYLCRTKLYYDEEVVLY